MPIQTNNFFHSLSDTTRLRCLFLLQQQGELCVCELVYALDLIQPKISRHLALLRDNGLVRDRRVGQWIYYRICPDLADWCHQVIQISCTHMQKQSVFQADMAKLLQMPNRPETSCCA